MQLVLHPLVGRDRGQQPLLRAAGELRCRLLAEGAGQGGRTLEILPRGRIGTGHESDREPGDDRVDPGFEHRDPETNGDHDGDCRASDRQIAQADQHAEQHDGDRQRGDRDMSRVDRRDHEQRGEIVDDREREQEDPDAGRRPRREQGKGAERERGVGRHSRTPAVRAGAASVEREEDRDGHDDPATSRQRGDREAAPVAELPEVELALGLEADD